MTKKKILVLALTIAMVAILAVGGSLAYFTSEDKAENTFTAGGVEIELIEQQVNEAGTALEGSENWILKRCKPWHHGPGIPWHLYPPV